MKGKVRIFARKAFALLIATAMSMPTAALAAENEIKIYDQNSSVMGLADNTENQKETKLLGDNSAQKETDSYKIDMRARFDALDKIIYEVKISKKLRDDQNSGEVKAAQDINLNFTPNPNSSIKNLKLLSAKAISPQGTKEIVFEENTNKSDLEGLKLKGAIEDEIVLEIAADVRQAEKSRTYDMDISLFVGEDKANISYNLIANKEIIKEEDKEIEKISLDLNDKESDNLKGEIESSDIFGLLSKKETISWTNYLANADKDAKEVSYEFNLDDNQDTTDTKINIDYYENTIDGYILKKEFSQAIDFAKKIEFEIPANYIAKMSLKTKVDKNNSKVKAYSLNNRQVKNPSHKEEEKTPADDDEEDHQADSKTEEKPSQTGTENQDKKEDQDIKIDDANNEAEKESDTEITVTDSKGQEVPVEVKENTEEEIKENQADKISALILNKDSLLSELEADNNLDQVKKAAIEDLANDLDSYNDEKITQQELFDFTKKLRENYNIDKTDLRFFIESILSGLNKQTNKAANLNIDEILGYAYPEDTNEKAENKSEENNVDKKEEKSQKEQVEKTQEENLPADKTEKETTEEKKDPSKTFDEDLAKLKDAANKEEEKPGLLDNLKSLMGLTDLAKADKELKAALSDESKTLEEIQNLLNSFEEKYNLSKVDQAKLMDDNGEAIKALIDKDSDKNFRPDMLLDLSEEEVPQAVGDSRALTEAEKKNLENKKFNIVTRFDTSTVTGDIPVGQFFIIHLDNKLTVKNSKSLQDIYHLGKKIAEPSYDKEKNEIKYTIANNISGNYKIPLNIPVDYNTDNITLDDDGTFTVINKVSGLGVKAPKDLVPQKVDKDGNLAGSIIEEGREDVEQIVDSSNGNYRFDMNVWGNPVVKDGELKGFNWSVNIDSDKDLTDGLGMKLNLTTVKGSGLGEIQYIKLNGKSIEDEDEDENEVKDQLVGATGIVDSKHHSIKDKTTSAKYTFYTEVENKQGSYMLDVSILLSKQGNKVGAVRSIIDKGYPQDKIEEAGPTRVGMNNRTTILGEFTSTDRVDWTITDAVSTGDDGKLPLESRKVLLKKKDDTEIQEDFALSSTNTHYYVINEDGKMVEDNSISTENKPVGTIGVYENYFTGKEILYQNLNGVKVSKYQDIHVDQDWNLPVAGMTMPGQDFIAKDNDGTELGKFHEDPGAAGKTTRFVTIPEVKYWNIDESGKATKNDIKIEQKFDKDTVDYNGKTYKYNENANYYQIDTNSYYIHDSAIPQTDLNPVTFTVVKVDSKDPNKKLSGARFKLLGSGELSIVTDSEGRATFNNVYPGTYYLTEEKAPAGYKLDQAQKTITISENGNISVNGSNIQSGGSTSQTKLVQHDSYPNWPDYMNAMHYGKINDSGEVEFYLYLKPQSNNGGNGTNRDTRLNISIPGVDITDVTAYDVSPGYRNTVKYSMEQQNVDGYIPLLGDNVINAANNNKITGTPNKTDPYTGKTGYQIYFPEARFANDWGFLVKVKANIGDKQSVSLDYDWLTDKDTAEQTKLTQNVIISKSSGEAGENQLIVTNEEFTKSPISATKFGDTFDNDGKRNRLPGAEFVLKDSKGNVIANKITDDKGTADFGKYPPGTYRLEEKSAPDGYQKNGVYFEVVVDEQGQVTYTARFEDGIGTPQVGRDYYIEKGQETGESAKATVTSVNQRLEYLENEPGDIGTKTGVWEAYSYESLKYHADVTLTNVSEGSRFEIQFDRNLDFTQYFSEFPKIVIDGEEVADPYFDYNTNLLTYVFNNKAKKDVTASINLRGIIPDKFFAKETGQYDFTIKVAPGVSNVGGNPNLTKTINADYGRHHTESGDSNQSYYFRDVYQKEDGNWYVTVLTYLNPLGFDYSAKTVRYNWITTDFQSNRIAEWSGKGYEPLYELNDVKVYGTDYGTYRLGDLPLNRYMPLSMGIRPEQEPNIYHLLVHQSIDPGNSTESTQNGIYIKYNQANIKTNEKLATKDINKAPLIVKVPKPKDKGGYVVEQTFKITDIEKFNTKWRAFYVNDGNLTSAFASKANINTAIGDQAGGEIPKYYREIVGLINDKYTPGNFKLTKYDEANPTKKLPNATFALTDENGKVIYRTSDANGEVNFSDIAPGRYSLEEVRAPKDYQLTNKKWQVTVLSDGSVRIRETSITGESKLYTNATVPINIPVSNKPAGQKFRVYKKDGDGRPLAGAKFKISDPDNTDSNFPIYATSNQNGIVEFNGTPQENKNYVLEEVEPPTGYNPLNKKWVLRVEDGKVKVYNYSESTEIGDVEKSLLGEDGTEWVDVKGRNTSNWSDYDNRWTGWVGNNQNAEHLGTRIIAINKTQKYVVQRYIINPEAKNIDGTTAATIHREKPEYPNMDWYKGDEEIKIFTLEAKEGGNTTGKVTGLISDLRLAPYKVTDITNEVKKSKDNSHHGETRLKLELPATNKPIVVDVKVPYHDENGGIGTGMDWREGDTTYWKSDYYERVSDIKTSGIVSETGGTIVGSYVAEGSLDVTNSIKTYGFKIKKVKEGEETTLVPGAVFKLTGPEPSPDEKFMTTGKDGMISFDGLKPGKYKLEEEKPAPGYEKANTDWTVRITDEGKVYIKDNDTNGVSEKNANVSVSDKNISATNNLMRRLQMAGANTELEISGNLVDTLNPLRAESDWEDVDPDRSNPPDNRSDSSNVKTKITQINKVDGKYRQIFLVNLDNGDMTYSKFDFHAQPLNSSIIGEGATKASNESYNFKIVSIKSVTNDSTIDNIKYDGESFGFKEAKNFKSGSYKRFSVKLNSGYTDKTLAVEVEYTYPKSGPIGVGMDYYAYSSAQKQWAAENYKNIDDINYKPLVKYYKLNVIPSQNGSVTSAKTTDIEENERLTLEVNPNYGYELEQLVVDGTDVTEDVVDNKYPYDMPNHDVTVTATFKAKTYNITYDTPQNGTISVKDKAQYGEEVEVTVTPKDGFKTTSVTMNEQTLTADNDGKYRFEMPADNANISASFTRKGPEQRISDPLTITEEIPFEIQESVDKNLKPGEVAIDTQGKNGSVQYEYSITYEKSEGTSVERPKDWPDDAPVAAPQTGERVISYNKIEVDGSRVNPTTQIQRKGPAGAEEGEKEIPSDGFAQITNKQTGLDLKIYKKDRYDRKLEGAIFTIRKTDENYKNPDTVFGVVKGESNADGLVVFKDKDDKPLRLPVGYYLIEETAAPLGYRKPNAPWKVEVVEENGQLVAKYKGPEETPQSFIEKNENLDIKEANGVKYATKITHIDTESRTFIQRVYIDTRGKDGVVNVQIKPKHKREEIDRPGLPPVTITEGVKTAYRSTYKISGINGDPDQAKMIKILNDYDVSYPDVTVVNTARWRPFDWGFDEDQLNLEPGVYYIDIEGFYDTSIIDRNVTNEVAIDENYNFTKKDGVTPSDEPVLKDPYVNNDKNDLPDEDLGKIDIDIEFFDGKREFQQLYITDDNTIDYKTVKDENGKDEASYQMGADALRQWLFENRGEEAAKAWANLKPEGKKYVNALGKDVTMEGSRYLTGKIVPPLGSASSTIKTSIDISSLYSSNKENIVPQEGLDIENDEERYNITFSKHGRKTDTDSEEEITKNRLEGAVFKLEKRVREGIYEEVEGSYVSSAFNGYFGFRGLEPGRYRLLEVQAPKGYKPIDGTLLYFSVETVSIASKLITDPRTGENINVETVEFYFLGNTKAYKFEDLEMRDPTDDTKIIKFSQAKNADLETTKIIDPTDPNKETEVSLRELSVKFPGEIKDKDGKVVKDTYLISEIQVTPTSNGYISLEYDKANGVYQYIPEESTTEENGLLVDFVTSATAKNMGKIVDEKPGQGKVTINKVDQEGNALKGTANEKGELIAGAKFRLTNLTDGSKPVEKIVGTDGSLVFEGLKIGNYKLEEIESPDGHINSGQEWFFTVGGKDLDPYSGDIAPTGRDLTNYITLTSSDMTVINPQKKDKSATADGEIHPHVGESMEFDNKFELADNIKINPGDYFQLKVADDTDLFGIFVESISNLDLFADGVGTIAKASYDKEKGIITYTFTDYAKTYELVDFSNKFTSFINLDKVKNSDGLGQSHKVGFKMANDQTDTNYKNLRVVYDLDYALGYDENGQLMNMVSKIVKYNPETGEFVHYYYVNRLRYQPTGTKEFWYTSEQNIENLNISYSYLKNNNDPYLGQTMPESFGVNENSTNLYPFKTLKSIYSLPKGETTKFDLPNGAYWSDSCIVKVTGRVADKDKSTYKTDGRLVKYNSDGPWGVLRYDEVYAFPHEATAEAKLTIRAVNPSNKIRFKKVDASGTSLSGAKFQAQRKVVENGVENWNAYGQPITTESDGLVEINELPEGEYRLIETTAPDGFVRQEGPLVEFKVDINGKVYRKEVYKDDKDQTQEKYVEEPGIVPINLVNKREQEISFKKVDTEEKPLSGAEFEVWYNAEKAGDYSKDNIKLYQDESGNKLVLQAGEEVPSGYSEVQKFISGSDGLVKFKFYKPGYYAIKEIKAPSGYIAPKNFVKEFKYVDGKVKLDDGVQTVKYLTEMNVIKENSAVYANNEYNAVYGTDMTLRINPGHEAITYEQGKSKITLSGLPLDSEYFDANSKLGITISAKLVNKNNQRSTTKTSTVPLTKYDANDKGEITIDLYSLVKVIEQKTETSITSENTIELSMYSSLALDTKLDIVSNIEIGDETKEDRTFHIGTKGDAKENHSYSFAATEETEGDNQIDPNNPIEIVNKKGSLPNTNGLAAWIGYTLMGLVVMVLAGFYYNKKKTIG